MYACRGGTETSKLSALLLTEFCSWAFWIGGSWGITPIANYKFPSLTRLGLKSYSPEKIWSIWFVESLMVIHSECEFQFNLSLTREMNLNFFPEFELSRFPDIRRGLTGGSASQQLGANLRQETHYVSVRRGSWGGRASLKTVPGLCLEFDYRLLQNPGCAISEIKFAI